MNFVVMRLITQ